ncbi:MAG: potassium channel protein [Tunicatimonas sp.]
MRNFKLLTLLRRVTLNRLVIGMGVLVISMVIGEVGFMMVEEYSPVEAFYMTVITLSTVGFSEVKPLSDAGRLFTSFYIIFNLGIFAYAISLLTAFIVEGEFRETFRKYITSRRVQRLSDHIIVCGFGRNGVRTCEELLQSDRAFVVVEQNPQLIKSFPDSTNFQYIIGDATADDTLLEAGIDRAEAIITTLPKDTDNVFIALTARELNPNVTIISRASEESSEKKLLRAGANQVVMPDAIGGIHMARLITKPDVIKFLNILTGASNEHLKLEDFTFDEIKAEYQHRTLRQLNIRQHTGATVIGFRHHATDFTFNPPGDLEFGEGDAMIIIGTDQSIQSFKAYYT